jgi:chromosome segregation ATPase
MLYNHARYRALRNDYAALEARFVTHSNNQSTLLPKNKKIYMKNHNNETLAVDDNAIEKRELSDKLEQVTRSYQRLEEENRFLQEQISLETAGDDEKDKITARWKEENIRLRNKITEQDYLEEVLEEKKAQIVFLQQQLELRIRNQHRADQQSQQSKLEMQDAHDQRQATLGQFESLKNELLQKKERADGLTTALQEKEERLSEIQQQLKSKLDHITWLENSLSELKEQNSCLNAEAADERDQVKALKQLLDDERSRQQLIEQKFLTNRQMLQRLYKELALCLNEEIQESPIVPLRPSYIRDESAVH